MIAKNNNVPPWDLIILSNGQKHSQGRRSEPNAILKLNLSQHLFFVCVATNRGYTIALFIHLGKFWMMSSYLMWDMAAEEKYRAMGHRHFDLSITEP